MLYKMKDVVTVTGMNVKKLDQWYQKGILTQAEPPRRSGCAAGFSVENMVEILLTEKLSNAGIVLRVAGIIATNAIQTLAEHGEGLDFNDIWVVVNLDNTDEVEYLPENHNIKDLYESSLALNVGGLYDKVHKALEQIPA